jgi:hypothetical protein
MARMTRHETGRRVRLIVCSSGGEPIGTLPEFPVETPWWPDVEPVVDAARAAFGIEIVVLRLLATDAESDVMGGSVSYLVELVAGPSSGLTFDRHVNGRLDEAAREEHVLRAPWARPGGVAATLGWADDVLADAGRPRTARAIQVKSWNLSSILRLPTARGDVWSKSVPPFMAHEGAILEMIGADDRSLVPRLLARTVRRGVGTVIMGDVPGRDQFDAAEGQLLVMVRSLVRLQAQWAERVEELLAAGLPDWRAPSLTHLVDALLARPDVRRQLTAVERSALDALASDLERRLGALSACGIPESLVHGDFHPGNWRGGDDRLVLLDWGDSGVGHPMLDLAAFLPRVPEAVRATLQQSWIAAWRRERPRADPARAAALIAPVAALRQAVVYQRFLDGIEPRERRYHEADVSLWLRRAAALGD